MSIKVLNIRFYRNQLNNQNIILLWQHRSEKHDAGTFQIIFVFKILGEENTAKLKAILKQSCPLISLYLL